MQCTRFPAVIPAKGNVKEKTCEFFLTTKYSANAPTPTSGDGEVSLKVYQHDETFESNYKVELEKRDYETGNPLQVHMAVLEQFDDSQLSDDETDGGIIEDNMKKTPQHGKTGWCLMMIWLQMPVGIFLIKIPAITILVMLIAMAIPISPEPEIDESEEGEGEEGKEAMKPTKLQKSMKD